MDVSLHCGVCGADGSFEDVEPAINIGILAAWRAEHTHSTGELKMYLDADVAVRQYQHTHKFGELDGDD